MDDSAGEAGRPREPTRLALHVLILAAALTWLCREAIFEGQTFVGDDLTAFHRPLKWMAARLLRESPGLPLWNPLDSAGQPFAANPQHAVFHPLTWLFVALPFEWAFRLQVLLPLLAAGLSMRFLAQSAGLSPLAALLAAITWAYGGYTLSATNLWPTLLSISVLPLTLAMALRLGRSGPNRRDLAGLGLAYALQCIAGEPASLVVSGPLVLVASLHGARLAGRKLGRSGFAALLGGLLLALAIAAPSLLPGLDLARKTTRAHGLPAEEAQVWSLHPLRLSELLLPPWILTAHHGGSDWSWMAPWYPEHGRPYFYSLYPGLVATALALLAWIAGPRVARVWLGPAALGLSIALGRHFVVWPVARHLPLLSGIRFPEKFILPGMVALTLAAGLGLDSLQGKLRRGRGLLVALTLVDLLVCGRRLISSIPPSAVRTPPAALAPAIAEPERGYLFHQAALAADRDTGPAPGSPPLPALWGLATALEIDFDRTELAWSSEATERVWTVLAKMPELSGAVLARRHIAWVVGWSPRRAGVAPALELFAVPGVRPFAFFAERVVVARGGEAWLSAVRALGPAAVSAAIVEGDPGAAPDTSSRGQVVSLVRRPDSVELAVAVEGPASGFLAINQTWDPGWQASVDGVPAKLLRTDLALSGLVVPSGARRVVLEYRAPLVKLGEAIGLLGLLTAGVLLFRRPQPGLPPAAAR